LLVYAVVALLKKDVNAVPNAVNVSATVDRLMNIEESGRTNLETQEATVGLGYRERASFMRTRRNEEIVPK